MKTISDKEQIILLCAKQKGPFYQMPMISQNLTVTNG